MRRCLTVFLLLSPLLLVRCASAPAPSISVGCCAIPPLVLSIYFKRGDTTLNETAQQGIRGIATHFINRPEKRIEIVGYSDLSDEAEVNLRLSRRRAEVVAAALIALNVPMEKMEVRSSGPSDPRVPAAPGQKEPQNRRVDVNGSYP